MFDRILKFILCFVLLPINFAFMLFCCLFLLIFILFSPLIVFIWPQSLGWKSEALIQDFKKLIGFKSRKENQCTTPQ